MAAWVAGGRPCLADCHTDIVRLPVWSGDLRLVDGGDSAEGRLERCNDDRPSTQMTTTAKLGLR